MIGKFLIAILERSLFNSRFALYKTFLRFCRANISLLQVSNLSACLLVFAMANRVGLGYRYDGVCLFTRFANEVPIARWRCCGRLQNWKRKLLSSHAYDYCNGCKICFTTGNHPPSTFMRQIRFESSVPA